MVALSKKHTMTGPWCMCAGVCLALRRDEAGVGKWIPKYLRDLVGVGSIRFIILVLKVIVRPNLEDVSEVPQLGPSKGCLGHTRLIVFSCKLGGPTSCRCFKARQ